MVSLYKYFIWADRMRVHFDKTLQKDDSGPMFEDGHITKNGLIEHLYMSYWYAALYVVIEGWQELKLEDKSINSLLKSNNVDLLKRYRHGVFHYQPEYWNNRLLDFITREGTADWIRAIHEAFSRFFLEWARKEKETQNLPPIT